MLNLKANASNETNEFRGEGADKDDDEDEDHFVANNTTFVRQETVLHNPDMNVAGLVNPYLDKTVEQQIIAPGEGNLHLPFLQDQYNEELCFLKIYGGEQPVDYLNSKKFTYNAICKSEVRRYDRRVAENLPKLFYMAKKLLAKNMLAGIDTCLSKTKNTEGLTVSGALDKKKMNEFISDSEASLVMRTCRSSPQFWQWKKMEINAMIRQLGCPSMFITFSPAEKDWIELLIIVAKALDGLVLTEEDAADLSLEKRRDYLSRDPVNVARYFENRMVALFKVIFNEKTIFSDNPMQDHFWRVDFQYTGSPHIHMLAWMKDAPTYQPTVGDENDQEKNREDCINFIDKYITCERPVGDQLTVHDLVANAHAIKEPFSLRYQFHRHMANCKIKDRDGKFFLLVA